METNREYYIKCHKCEEIIAEARNIQKLFERMMELVARNNAGTEDALCEQTTDDISFDEVRGAFAGEEPEWQVYKPVRHEEVAVEWEKESGGL